MRDVEVRSCLGQSNHEIVEFSILAKSGRQAAKLLSLTSGG